MQWTAWYTTSFKWILARTGKKPKNRNQKWRKEALSWKMVNFTLLRNKQEKKKSGVYVQRIARQIGEGKYGENMTKIREEQWSK